MKGKSFRVKLFLTMILAVLACLPAVISSPNVAYAVETDSVESFALYYEGHVTNSDTAVGEASGYGLFVLNAKDRTLTATSYEGYEIVGWQVTYLENDLAEGIERHETKIILKGETSTLKTKSGTDVNVVIEYSDETKDGHFDKSTFTLTQVFEDIKVVPLFDYIYHQLNINSIAELDLPDYYFNVGNDVVYTSTENPESATELDNVVIKIGENYFYYGKLYSIDEEYITLHDGQEINYARGAFRLGESVEIVQTLNFNKDDVKSGSKIDVQGFELNNSALIENDGEAIENYFTLTKDDKYNLTTEYSLNVTIENAIENILEINYHELQIAKLNVYLDDNTLSDEEALDQILSIISVENYFSKIDDDEYFVKKSNDTDFTFYLVCAENYNIEIDGNIYYYFNFASLDGETKIQKHFNNISTDFEIEVKYTSVKYNVDFKFVDVSNGGFEVDNAINIHEPIALMRGENFDSTATDDDFEPPNYTGYSFKGFADETQTLVDSVSYTLDITKPANKTIYLCYEKIEYVLRLLNINQNVLTDTEDNSVYAINKLSLLKDGETREEFLGSSLTSPEVLEEYEFGTKIKINETISLNAIVNTGFEDLKFTFALNGEDTIFVENNSFVFNKEFIELASISFDEEGEYYYLPIYTVEEYVNYTLTYFTELTHDHLVDENVIMANLSVDDVNESAHDYKFLTASEEETVKGADDLAKIEISKIKHYEIITLQSSGKQDASGNNYVFVMFTEDNKSSLAKTEDEGTYSFTTSPINRSFSIKVKYAVPVASVEVVSNISAAYSGVSITQNGQEVVFDEELQVLKLTVGLDLTISVETNFGYKIIGYELTVNGQTTLLSSTDATYSLVTVEHALPHTVEIMFETIKYNFHFTQVGGGKDDEKIQFINEKGETVDYLTLDVDNRAISFNKPTGYYVNITKFVLGSGEEVEYLALNESNEKRNSANNEIYSYAFELEEFENVVTNYQRVNAGQIEVHVKIEYEIYKFNVSVQYSLDDYKEGLIFPEITLEYGAESIKSKYDSVNKTLSFDGAPYGSKITLKVSNEIQTGLSAVGWKNSNGNDLDLALFDKIETYELSSKSGIQADKGFVYKLSYIMYKLELNYDGGQGTPQVYLNEESMEDLRTIQIRLFDSFIIQANPIKENGYKFDNFYKSNDYSEGNTLDQSKIVDGEFYEETDFRVENYLINGTTLTIYLKYDLMEIAINNLTLNYNKTNLNGVGSADRNARINILLEDYAFYTVEARQSDNGAWRLVNVFNGDKVSAKDNVRITIQVNKNAINQFDGQTYDLTKGVILFNDIKLAGQSGYTWSGGTDGKYILTFEVSKIVSKLNVENPVINIEYRYEIKSVELRVTANIVSDESFYSGINLLVNEGNYGFNPSTKKSNGASSVVSKLQFLGMAHASYEWSKTEYREYFRINNVEIKDSNGIKIDSSAFASRGIRINYKDGGNKEIENVVVRYLENITVVLQIAPIILYDGEEKTSDYEFSTFYHCDVNGNGIGQVLTVGTLGSANISSASQEIIDAMMIAYTDSNGIKVDAPMACGLYHVNITFKKDTYKWLADIKLPYSLTWKINPRPIVVTYIDEFDKATKSYDGLSSCNHNEVLHLLRIVDGLGGVLNVSYDESNKNGGYAFINDKSNSASITITSNGEQVEIKKANENAYYNIQIKNLRLSEKSFNKSFILINDSVVIPEYIQITRRQVTLDNLEVYDKVEDGTKVAGYNKESVKISDKSKIAGDELYLDAEKVKIEFEDASVGVNKNVLIDATKALTGADASNYYVEQSVMTNKTIYPHKVAYVIKDVGTIWLINERGLKDYAYVGLIPVSAELKVEMIVYDSAEYAEIYRFIAKHLNRGNEFAVGYKLSLWLDGEEIDIDKNLLLSVPYTDRLTDVAYLTGEQSNKLEYQLEDGQVIINLNQINEDIDSIILLKSRNYMKWWQILIIVLSLLLILIAIIIITIITRRRKKEKYSVNEKI